MIAALFASPLVRKIAIWGLIALAVGYALRLWTNRIYDQGKVAGRVEATKDIEEAKKAEWAKREADLQGQLQMVADARRGVDQAKAELDQARYNLRQSLSQTLTEIRTRETIAGQSVASIPADQLDAALRVLSAELAATATKP